MIHAWNRTPNLVYPTSLASAAKKLLHMFHVQSVLPVSPLKQQLSFFCLSQWNLSKNLINLHQADFSSALWLRLYSEKADKSSQDKWQHSANSGKRNTLPNPSNWALQRTWKMQRFCPSSQLLAPFSCLWATCGKRYTAMVSGLPQREIFHTFLSRFTYFVHFPNIFYNNR